MDAVNRKAFTLIELLTVIAIIAIMMGVVRPMLSESSARARELECESHLQQIAVALHSYVCDAGAYPGMLSDLDPIIKDRNILVCPRTGRTYWYRRPGPESPTGEVVVCCTDPRKLRGVLPHRGGERSMGLTAGGGIVAVRRR